MEFAHLSAAEEMGVANAQVINLELVHSVHVG